MGIFFKKAKWLNHLTPLNLNSLACCLDEEQNDRCGKSQQGRVFAHGLWTVHILTPES